MVKHTQKIRRQKPTVLCFKLYLHMYLRSLYQVIGTKLCTKFMHHNNLIQNCRHFESYFSYNNISEKLSVTTGN